MSDRPLSPLIAQKMLYIQFDASWLLLILWKLILKKIDKLNKHASTILHEKNAWGLKYEKHGT